MFILDQKKRLQAAKWLFAALVFASFFYITAENRDPDLGWHLKTGEWILEHRAIQRFDKWSHTMSGYEWIDHEWLLNAWMHWMNARGLWPIVIFFFSLLASLPIIWSVRRAASFLEILFISAVSLEILRFIGVRPQLISFVFFAFLFEVLSNPYFKERFGVFRDFGIPLIFFVWANLHAGFPAGLLLLFLFIVGDLMGKKRRAELTAVAALKHAAVLLASFLATLITPHGFDLYHEIWNVATSSLTAKYIVEWLPAFALLSPAVPFVIALPFIFFFKYFRRYAMPMALAFAAFSALYLKSSRNIFFYAVAAMPVMRQGSALLKEEIARAEARRPAPRGVARLTAFIKIFLVGALIAYWCYALYASPRSQIGRPESALQFLKQEVGRGKPVKLLNAYSWGGYIIAQAPEIKVFIDGRMPHWKDESGNSAMEEYAQLFYSDNNGAKRDILARRGINTILLGAEQDPPKDGWIARLIERLPEERRERIGKSRTLQLLNKALSFPESLVYGETTDLREVLREDGWEIAYEDDVAAVFRCPEYKCAPSPP